MELPREELRAAFEALPDDQRTALEAAAQRVTEYHRKQIQPSWSYRDDDGTLLGQQVTPLDRVGLYVPGGKAAYPSSVLMNALPAKVAGVAELIMVVPTPDGVKNQLVLAAAYLSVWIVCLPSGVRRLSLHWPMVRQPFPRWTRSSAPVTPMWPPPSAACSVCAVST